MTVEELIEALRRLDPTLRVVLAEENGVENGRPMIRGVEIVDVYEAKATDVGDEDEFLRVFRLGHPKARPEIERVVVIDDKIRK